MFPPGYLQYSRACLLQLRSRGILKEQAGVFAPLDFCKSNEEKVKEGLGKLKY